MKINELQLEQVNKQIQALEAAGSFYGKNIFCYGNHCEFKNSFNNIFNLT